MSRLDIMTPSHAQTVIDGLYRDVERRIAASPPGLCPVDLAKSFLDLCHAQTCGKCVPCRIGLGQLSELMEQVLEGEATMETISIIERVARVIVNSADCAIGRDAARLVLDGVQGFRDDYEEHILRHRCLGGMREPVPCVALCPAGVDIPGYLVLIKYGRYADAVRLIRKDNPFPSACAYICEHPCEARCRRNMIDDAVNIRGLKRYAVDNAGYVPQPDCAEPTGKKVAVIGGGPSGLSAAYYLALMGHKVTVYEKCAKLGGMLRYGIPNYRLPREVLDAEIASMLALGIDVHVNVNVGDDVTFDELRQQNDALYIALGAHTDKKTGIEGEDAGGVISAVEMLREIGDDHMPDFRNKDIVILEDEFKQACDHLYLMTDDGSYGRKGLVTEALKELLDEGNVYDEIFAIGPMVMMKFVCKTTAPYNMPTTVSMSPIMIDGTGMCGGCRLTVGGETKFACVDGPDFDGHKVDWDLAVKRNQMYHDFEVRKHEEVCNLFKQEVK